MEDDTTTINTTSPPPPRIASPIPPTPANQDHFLNTSTLHAPSDLSSYPTNPAQSPHYNDVDQPAEDDIADLSVPSVDTPLSLPEADTSISIHHVEHVHEGPAQNAPFTQPEPEREHASQEEEEEEEEEEEGEEEKEEVVGEVGLKMHPVKTHTTSEAQNTDVDIGAASTRDHDIDFVPEQLAGALEDPIEALRHETPLHTDSFPIVPPLPNHPIIKEPEREEVVERNLFGDDDGEKEESFFAGGLQAAIDEVKDEHGIVSPAPLGTTLDNESNPFSNEQVDKSNPFGDEPVEEDSFFAHPTEASAQGTELDLFSEAPLVEDDFFSDRIGSVEPIPPAATPPNFTRTETGDVLMGGNAEIDEPDRFAEGMPLFDPQEETVEDDFFAQTKPDTATDVADDEGAFFESFDASKRKSTGLVTGFDATEHANGKTSISEPVQEEGETEEELAKRWAQALADDDFLEDDDELQPETTAEEPNFFADDGEGFLSDEETEDVPPPPVQPVQSAYPPAQPYTPNQAYPNAQTSLVSPQLAYVLPVAPSPYAQAFQPVQAEPAKIESFLDKRGGYHSPYDLPEDIAKPIRKKPPPFQQTTSYAGPSYYSNSPGVPPSHNMPPPPHVAGTPPTSAPLQQDPLRGRDGYGGVNARPPPPSAPPTRTSFSPAPSALPSKAIKPQAVNMFEDLPMPAAKPRNVSNSRYAPPGVRTPSTGPSAIGGRSPSAGPIQASLGTPIIANRAVSYNGQPSAGFSPAPVTPLGISGAQLMPQQPLTPGGSYARSVSPYAPAPSTPGASGNYTPRNSSFAGSATSGYAPQPPSAQRSVSPYLPQKPTAPAVPRVIGANSLYAAAPSQDVVAEAYDPQVGISRSSTGSRPGTMERNQGLGGVAEEEGEGEGAISIGPSYDKPLPPPPPPVSQHSSFSSRYAPAPAGVNGDKSRMMSPPPPPGQASGNYAASAYNKLASPPPEQFIPPRRSQTQSPGFAAIRSAQQAREPYQRPSSAAAAGPHVYSAFSPVEQHARNMSYSQPPIANLNFVPPAYGSIAMDDPLERWKGCPLFSWSFGGSVVTMHPMMTQRWDAASGQQMVKSSPGEVKIRPAKDLLGTTDTFVPELSKFPGPVYGGKTGGKGRKKDVAAWMDTRIALLESVISVDAFGVKKQNEKVMLWKLVKACLENDGQLEGTPEIQKIVREIVNPGIEAADMSTHMHNVAAATTTSPGSSAETIAAVRTFLLNGDRESAVWHSIEKAQWAHAILIASTVSPELFQRTVQEFVRQEVKVVSGPGSESLAVLYEVFAGNSAEAIDDLIPASARMGMRMMNTSGANDDTTSALEKLEKWRETLGLILSNRSSGDADAIFRLGRLLEGYGRTEAAHICYLFCRQQAIFGGADDPASSFTLLGADHIHNPFNYARDTDTIVLSEVYELALSLSPAAPALSVIPHLQAYKLQHATLLAQYGYQTEAQKYCEAIAAALKSSTRASPYFQPQLFMALEELNKRLSQAPKDSSGSWISKPTLDGISGSLMSKFNKFVQGGDEDKPADASDGAEVPIFSKIAGNTPDVSRNNSVANLYNYGSPTRTNGFTGGAGSGRYDPGSGASGRYGPKASGHASITSYDGYQSQSARPSMDSARPSIDSSRPSLEQRPANLHEPQQGEHSYGAYNGGGGHSYEPTINGGPLSPPMMSYGGYSPQVPSSFTPQLGSSPMIPTYGGFEAPVLNSGPPMMTPFQPPSSDARPSYSGYEPPAAEYQPYVPDPDSDEDEAKKQKKPKKSFMDDDDGFAKPASGMMSKEQEEEENRKMVAAIAEREKQEAEEAKKQQGKKGWLGGWFGGKDKSKDQGPTVYKAKLGEENSFYYDPDLKKWINKKGGAAEQSGAPAGTPPPPRRESPGPPRPDSASSTGSGGAGLPPPSLRPAPTSAPAPSSNLAPPGPPGGISPAVSRGPSPAPPSTTGGPPRPRSDFVGTPPPDALDDLLGPPGGGSSTKRATGKSKARKRYVEIM